MKSLWNAFILIFLVCSAETSRAAKGLVTLSKLTNIVTSDQEKEFYSGGIDEKCVKQVNLIRKSRSLSKRMVESRRKISEFKEKIDQEINGVVWPQQLWAIAVVESALNENVGRAGARRPVGMWQITKDTALRLGLQVSKQTDERKDVKLSTQAAMTLLIKNYNIFNNWPLAILAYNRGADAVQKKMKRTGFKTSNELLSRGFKTHKDYVPKVLATALVIDHPELLE